MVTRIEKGAPGTAVGTVIEAAILCGAPLFGVSPDDLDDVAERTRDRLAPQRVRAHRIEIDNDF